MARDLVIPGEYDYVSRASRDPEALLAAHATPCTRAEAQAMLAALAAEHGVEGLRVRITKQCRRGRGGRRAAYGVKRESYLRWERVESTDGVDWEQVPAVRRKRVHLGVVPFVTLPAIPRALASARCVTWAGLRVGLVLHEFAHVLRPRAGHSHEFTACLDNLVAGWIARGGLDAQRVA